MTMPMVSRMMMLNPKMSMAKTMILLLQLMISMAMTTEMRATMPMMMQKLLVRDVGCSR